jgi:N-acetylated-alpha-linked acidic dipeptidase
MMVHALLVSRSLIREIPVMRRAAIVVLGVCLFPLGALTAQGIIGFSPAAAARQATLEARLRAVPDSASSQEYTRALAARPHVAGSPAQKATADYVLKQMASWGLDTSRVAFKVFLPYHDSTFVERITPTRLRLSLNEPAVPGDPTTDSPPWPAMNGTSGKGDVTAPLVYVNYGLPVDYATLEAQGVSVKGKIAIVRYGRSFRGIKAREAESHGAVGLLIFSDPQDDGFGRGAVYPDGPMRNPQEVQRGSIFNGSGDPTTPGWASTIKARRLPEDSLEISHIPVVPIGYGNAELLMHDMGGAAVPEGWQGGMKFAYHLGDAAVQARVAVYPERGEKAYKTIYDTFGMIRGSEFPNEMVIVGGHRDAWGPGADDNVSGVVSIMEAAKSWAAASKAGMRPRRTIVFATWDAEEWGLVGSTEWVELMQDSLRRKMVAYLNQDESAAGRRFGAGGTASLQGFLREATKTVMQPGDTGSIYAVWSRGGGRGGAARAAEPAMGDLGGGSDFAGFYNYLGIPSIEFGFGGSAGWYHSAYDTWTAMEKFGDPGYLSHAAAGRLNAVLMARLANAQILPYNYSALGAYLGQLVGRAVKAPDDASLVPELAALREAAGRLEKAGTHFEGIRDSALALVKGPDTRFTAANRILRGVEQKLTRPGGLNGRPFMRNLIFAADRDNGYANIPLPGVVEALRDHDLPRARKELGDLTSRVLAASATVDSASAALKMAKIVAPGR